MTSKMSSNGSCGSLKKIRLRMAEVLTRKRLLGLVLVTTFLYLFVFLNEYSKRNEDLESKRLAKKQIMHQYDNRGSGSILRSPKSSNSMQDTSNDVVGSSLNLPKSDQDASDPSSGPKLRCKMKKDPNVYHEHWIVVTSIQGPTKTVKDLIKIRGWKLVVIGDTKSPSNWSLEGAIFLSVEKQKELCYKTVDHTPYKSYTRKNIGYLYALQHGAKYIYDTDDDNVPWDRLQTFHVSEKANILTVKTDSMVFNPYAHFGQASMWPRGYPVDFFASTSDFHNYELDEMQTPVVQQGLIDGDPDVDAYYRMTRKNAAEKLHLNFDAVGPPVALPRGTLSPYNSQNTLFTYDGFWSLLLPASTTFRTCDIYRSYWSQPLMWAIGKRMAFYPPNSIHYRNVHSYIADAKDEIDFLRMSDFLSILRDWECKRDDFVDCIKDLTQVFVDLKHYKYSDLRYAHAWLDDLQALGYKFPQMQQLTKGKDVLEVKYYPEEMPASLPHKREYYVSQEGRGLPTVTRFIDRICEKSVALQLMPIYSERVNKHFSDILMIIYDTTKNPDDVVMLESYHHLKRTFPRRLYCATELSSSAKLHRVLELNVLILDAKKYSEDYCLVSAMKLGFIVKGYLFVRANEAYLDHKSISPFSAQTIWGISKPADTTLERCMLKYSIPENCEKALSQRNSDSRTECLTRIDKSQTFPHLLYVPKKYSKNYLKHQTVPDRQTITSKICNDDVMISSISEVWAAKTKFCDLL